MIAEIRPLFNRREECGTVNIETDEKKSQRIKAEAVAGQIQQIGVVAYKMLANGLAKTNANVMRQTARSQPG